MPGRTSHLELSRSQILSFRRRVNSLDERMPAGPQSLRRAAWAGLQDSMPRAALLSIETSDGPVFTSRYARAVYATALGLAAFVMVVLLSQPVPDVVYKAF